MAWAGLALDRRRRRRRYYGDVLDGIVADERDAERPAGPAMTDTLMADADGAAARRRADARASPESLRVVKHATRVLPVKRFERAKQRLGRDLGDGSRWALAEAMVTDVLVRAAPRRGRSTTCSSSLASRAPSRSPTAGAPTSSTTRRSAATRAAATLGIRAALELGADAGAARARRLPVARRRARSTTCSSARRPRRRHRPRPPRHRHQRAAARPARRDRAGFGPGSCERHERPGRRDGGRALARSGTRRR